MFDNVALTKIQSTLLICVIVAASLSGVFYFFLSNSEQHSDSIKIGVLADLDGALGSRIWKGALLAVEQINAEGGILGKRVEVIGEDHDIESGVDINLINKALTRLLTYHKVDFIIGAADGEIGFMLQDAIAEHQKIYLSYTTGTDAITQRVLDDYEKYKYFFKYYPANTTQLSLSLTDQFLHIRNITGFNKIGYLAGDMPFTRGIIENLDYELPEIYGFDLVYKGVYPPFVTYDFSSYLAAAEVAGVEILMPLIGGDDGIPFVKEYYDRHSPMVVFGGVLTAGAGVVESWEQTDSKCEFVSTLVQPITAGYPFTKETLPFRQSYIERWGEAPRHVPAAAYDIIRFILFDAINRAETIETEAVIKALESTKIETTLARSFVFTSSHDVLTNEGMVSSPNDYGHIATIFQWHENATLVPIYPQWLQEEAGATYMFPPWPGPWD